MKIDLFQSCGHCWVFQICWHIECSTFKAPFFRIWNSSTGIPPPRLALFIVMLPKAHLTSHSRISGSRWVITPSWLSGPWCWEKLKAGGEGNNRGWDDLIASPTQWTWVWVNSRSWWWTGKPGMLQSMGLQRVRQDWATELNMYFIGNLYVIYRKEILCPLLIF